METDKHDHKSSQLWLVIYCVSVILDFQLSIEKWPKWS